MPRRVLIVEDDTALAGLMASVLEEAGYESDVVASPDAAQGTYDLIVSDYLAPMYLPGRPWPYLDRLRDLCQGGPILGCTGHQDALLDHVSALGITAVTTKPFDVDELLQLIEQLLEQGRQLAGASPINHDPAA
jgi:DNA-binding response OmpR family regulator